MTPSVTEVLGLFADFSRVNPQVLQEGQRRGTVVHQACGAICLGIWNATVPEEWRGYIESFRKFYKLRVTGTLLVEQQLLHRIHNYSGTPDLLLQLDDEKNGTLIDLKTPATESPTWKAQIAAYLELLRWNAHKVPFGGALMLNKDGKEPKLIIYRESPRDFNAFLSALNAYRYFKAK